MDIKSLPNVFILDNPLLTHHINIIRDQKTKTGSFKRHVKLISEMEAYEALKGVKTKDVQIQTPIEGMTGKQIDEDSLCFLPILRAGLGMLEGFRELSPNAHVGQIGLYRDEKTHLPHTYYCKLPNNIENMDVYIIDPMLATGGSALDAIAVLRSKGIKNISFVCIIAAPEGVEAVHKAHPDIPLFIGALDRCLNENAYICPGLGDAGDRIFGTDN